LICTNVALLGSREVVGAIIAVVVGVMVRELDGAVQ
jgi:hypothetical protein